MREEVARALRPLVDRLYRGHCWKKTKDGPRRIAEPFDELKFSEHCAGVAAYGLCPIAPGESTTRVALLDFDNHQDTLTWAEMRTTADMVADSLRIDGYKPVLFRSSGGKGIHLILVWDQPQDAHSVREMLRGVLAECGLKSGTKGVSAHEVEVYPKQDAVPVDGFGSMFVLPLSGKSVLLLV